LVKQIAGITSLLQYSPDFLIVKALIQGTTPSMVAAASEEASLSKMLKRLRTNRKTIY